MFDNIEKLAAAHEHTISALEAISTFAAVVVSLALSLLASRANLTKLKASASMMVVMHHSLEAQEKPSYLTVNILNTGIMPLRIPLSFCHIKIPFKNGVFIINPLDYAAIDEWIPQKTYPVEVQPKSSQTFYLATEEQFRENIVEMRENLNKLQRIYSRFWRFRVVTDDGVFVTVRLGQNVRTLIAEECKTQRPAA